MSLLGVFVLASLAHGQARPLSVEEMARRCPLIGVATVRSQSVSREPANGMINTTSLLEFTDLWKGEASGPLPLVQPGGQLGNEVAEVVGAQVTLSRGESIVVFATERTLGGFHVIGLRQGLYRVRPGTPSWVLRESEGSRAGWPARTLEELKDEVYRALGRPRKAVEEGASSESGTKVPSLSSPREPLAEEGRPAEATSPRSDPVPESRGWIGIVGAAVLVLAFVWIIRRGVVRV
jgi:hypothetical protein